MNKQQSRNKYFTIDYIILEFFLTTSACQHSVELLTDIKNGICMCIYYEVYIQYL